MSKCLIIDKLHSSIFSLLEEIGYEVDYEPDMKREEICNVLGKYTGLILRSKTTVDANLLVNAEKLEWVGRAGAGIDQLDVEEIERRGIHILNAPEGNCDALAEHTIGLILAVLNKFTQSDRQIRNNIWDREGNRGTELGSMTVGIIGYGFMGKAVCRRLKAFGCRVIGYDKYLNGFDNSFIEEASLEEMIEETDLLSLHIPLTDETFKMVDHDFLDNFEKSIYLINTARGEIVDMDALNDALESGKILGAGLDVLENEKLHTHSEEDRRKFDRLKTFENVIITPHVGGWSYESYERINTVLVQKIKDLIEK